MFTSKKRVTLALTLGFALASLVPLGVSCGSCDAPGTPPPLLALTDVPGPGQTVCAPVTEARELIGGPQAFAQVGRAFRCNNSKIRFIVQDASRPVGNSVRGGNLIDVDLMRPSDIDGEDTFREHVTAIAAKEIEVEKIEIVSAGGDNVDAVVRVSGVPSDLTLAPQAYYLSSPIEGTLVTDYILHPNASYIEIKTTLKNAADGIVIVQPADFVAFGGATVPHTPESGFGDVEVFSGASWLSSTRGEKVSYALVSADGDVVIPFIDQGITAPFYGDSVPVSSDRDFIRWFIVGDGSLESTTRLAYELKELAQGKVRGIVEDASGARRAGILVSALSARLDVAGAHVVNEARTDSLGNYELTLAPGTYHIVAHAPGLAKSAQIEIDAVDGVVLKPPALVVGGTGHVRVTTSFTDRLGADIGPRPAKLTLIPLDDALRPSDVLREPSFGGGASEYVVSADGVFDTDLAPGRYTAYVTRGFEYTRDQHEIVVAAGGNVQLAASIAHVVDTFGLIGAEFHQHSLGSIDAAVPVARKVMENAAEGIELAASTDHDVITDFRPHVLALGLSAHLSVVAGSEVSYQGVGHFNAYPWDLDDGDLTKDDGARMWWLKTIPEMFSDVRAAAGDPIIQINHPRSQLTGYFGASALDPSDATRIPREPPEIPTFPATIFSDWASDFDAVEVNGNLGSTELYTIEGRDALSALAHDDAGGVPVLADYFALLGAGMKVTATGNSDTHRMNEGVGYPRNFLDVGTDDPSAVTANALRAAVRAQRNAVGEGCLMELFVDGARKRGVAEMIDAADGVTMKLQAPPHVTPGVVEIYVNGIVRPVVLSAESATLDAAGALSNAVPPGEVVRVDHPIVGLPSDEGDLIVLALSKGGGGLQPTGGGSVICYSAPLYVDVDGDGQFTGWLAATQQVLP